MFQNQNPNRPLPTSTYLVARIVLALAAGLVTTAYIARMRSSDLTSYSPTSQPVFLVAFVVIGVAGTVLRVLAHR
ncbi:hypothetical protein BH10ACT1_BH10ACT1_06870 [soil metagenome]